jgi:hypothetical protein
MFPAPDARLDTEQAFWLDLAEREHATTVRVLAAYPAGALDLQPTPKSPVANRTVLKLSSSGEAFRTSSIAWACVSCSAARISSSVSRAGPCGGGVDG